MTETIFNQSARDAKLRRARKLFSDHDFLHRLVAAEVVDRLETVLRPFPNALACGPGGSLLAEVLTDAAGVGELQVDDPLSPDAEPFAPGRLAAGDSSLDLVVSIGVLHALDDPRRHLAEVVRVLKPDGFFVGAFPGERSGAPLREALQRAEASVTGKVAPRVAPMIAVRDAGGLLQTVGLALPVADVVRFPISYAAPTRLFADLRGTGETSCLARAPKGALRRDVLAAAVADLTDRSTDGEGSIAMPVDIVMVTGWKPDPSQPKALAPGSARASIADAVRGETGTD